MKKYNIATILLVSIVAATLIAAQAGDFIYNEELRGKRTLYTNSIDTYVAAPSAGQEAIQIADSTTAPTVSHYDHVGKTWHEKMTRDEAQTISGAQTITGAITSSGANSWSGTNTFSAAVDHTGDVTAGDNEDDDITIDGQFIRKVFRQDFNCDNIVRDDADFTAEDLDADADTNFMYFPCGDQELRWFHTRIDGAQTSPHVVTAAGRLDIDGDAADDEGVLINFGTVPQPLSNQYDFGTAWYVRVGFQVAVLAGTDNIQIGWRIGEAYDDNNVITDIDTYGAGYWNSTLGNFVFASGDDGADTTDEFPRCDLTAATEMVIEVSFAAGGTFGVKCAASEALLDAQDNMTLVTTAASAFTTGEVMVPYISLLQTTAATTEMTIDFVEVGQVQ